MLIISFKHKLFHNSMMNYLTVPCKHPTKKLDCLPFQINYVFLLVLNRCLYNIAEHQNINLGGRHIGVHEIKKMENKLKSSNTTLSLFVHEVVDFFTDSAYAQQVHCKSSLVLLLYY